MLWVDKYRPTELGSLDYHDDITKRLESLAKNPASLPHLFFYGPSGAGKRTRIHAFLGALFGPSAHRLKLNQRTFTTPTGRTVDIHMISSDYHMELSPGDAGNNDRFVIQDVLKEIASSKNIRTSVENLGSIAPEKTIATNNYPDTDIKVVVLNQVDRLSKQAQAALRRTMEKYAVSCRLILCCDSPSKLIAPLRSRCLGIRVAAPVEDEISRILKTVATREDLVLPNSVAIKLARESNRNLRKALLMLEAAKVQSAGNGVISENQNLPTADWEVYIKQLAVDITKEQSPQTLMLARDKLYELLVNCIPASTILKSLTGDLVNNLDDSVKLEVIEWAAFYEHRLSTGSKDIFHLEAFVAKFMAIYKKYLNDLFG
mmetsp:Transcript_15777/g.36531  ORF Transcript_15777/g.36531 Transcript_15777/m.36531 type:complete len:374 (-) Transcript_15777:123-1244(-)|eukprot:CAMPEP_0197184436 /NCGR_PEP_ID=MMETSP1423-20130617/9858_1 /TAXON_ID=476441 /ORGANISM="Pseudo-nitzschia heimii, Strain UNC1101" /LENGTH=373 /DNA_ID=CAMNT_0042635241 /DNA_START=43 /DNA_END=1164 /DNA_ORIENTATION=+